MRTFRATVTVAVTLLVLDLCWLGLVADDLYDHYLGTLRAPQVNGLAAALFYAMYVAAIVLHAVRPATRAREAARRGAGLGFVTYATFELTNWAIIRDWPAALVPIDLAWGIGLTAVVALAGWRAGR